MNRAFSPESFRGWRFNLANPEASPQARNETAPLAPSNFERTQGFHISDRASISAFPFCHRADLEFWRNQRSLRLAAVSRLQSGPSSLRTDEPNDHVGPNQRPVGEVTG